MLIFPSISEINPKISKPAPYENYKTFCLIDFIILDIYYFDCVYEFYVDVLSNYNEPVKR